MLINTTLHFDDGRKDITLIKGTLQDLVPFGCTCEIISSFDFTEEYTIDKFQIKRKTFTPYPKLYQQLIS